LRGVMLAVQTADCVPILVADDRGQAVAAIHAGWRGTAARIAQSAVSKFGEKYGIARESLRAVIGPHIGPCCYEIDAPVLDALRHFDADLDAATTAGRPGHHQLDLGALARAALVRAGVSPHEIGALASSCTSCDAQRFHSYRRDGARAGRLVHWIAVRILDSAGSDA